MLFAQMTVVTGLTLLSTLAAANPTPDISRLAKRGEISIPVLWNEAFSPNGTLALLKAYNKWLHLADAPAAPASQNTDASDAAAPTGGKTGTVVAAPQHGDSEYLSPITIGGQRFTIDFGKLLYLLEEEEIDAYEFVILTYPRYWFRRPLALVEQSPLQRRI
jgi:hypothetical protein